MAIHSQDMVLYVYGKRENHPVPRGGGAGSPSSLARTMWGGDAAGSTAQNRGGGGGDAAEAEGYPVPQGKTAGGISCSTGGGRIHHDVHYLLKYKST